MFIKKGKKKQYPSNFNFYEKKMKRPNLKDIYLGDALPITL